MKKAASLEAAQQWEEAGEAYNKAATAYEAQGQAEEQTKALEKSASMYEKYADSLTNHTTPTHTTTPAPAPKPSTPTAEVHSTVETQAAVPLSKSQIVHTNKHGGLVVAAANGHVIDGVKVSIHDKDIESPSMVVAPNGTIHIAFREQAEQGSFCAIYHRSSSDGGKTWSTARNLSDSKPDLNVGRCQIAADGQGRVYVVWRYGFEQYDIPDLIPHAGTNNNLVYSVLTGSSWSKPISLHTPVTYTTQNTGSESFFMSTDPNGAVHVIWNQDPTILHPDLKLDDHHSYGVGVGMVMESKLDGASPSTPREIYLPPVSKPNDIPTCDGLDLLNGYVDGDGVAHFAALVQPTSVSATGNHFHVIDGENQSPSLDLPGSGGDYWVCQPTLLRDAQRRQHLITLYPAGELPGVRDYVVGNYDAPKVIRSIKTSAGSLVGFQAIQGPAGEMAAIMDMDDTNNKQAEELYVSTSNGGAWSTPVNVTNNLGRYEFKSSSPAIRSYVATLNWGYPGPATGAYDKSGHLLLLFVRNKMSLFSGGAFGVETMGGSTTTPNLMFLRF